MDGEGVMSLNQCKHGVMVGVVNGTFYECDECLTEAGRVVRQARTLRVVPIEAMPPESMQSSGTGALERAYFESVARDKALQPQKQRFEFIRNVIGPIYASNTTITAEQAFSQADLLWDVYYTHYRKDVEGD